VLQPEKASDPAFLAEFRALSPDVAVTAAYGQILTSDFLAIPKRATINIHPSLLPRWRGATPVPASLLAGETRSGVSILFTVKALDAGAIIVQHASDTSARERAGEMTARLFKEGGALLGVALNLLKDPNFNGIEQDPALVTKCKKIEKHDGLVDWSLPAVEIDHRFRAFDPWPGTYTFLGATRVMLEDLESSEQQGRGTPGAVEFDKTAKALVVTTGRGTMLIKRLKAAGGKSAEASAFWNGLRQKDQLVFQREPKA